MRRQHQKQLDVLQLYSGERIEHILPPPYRNLDWVNNPFVRRYLGGGFYPLRRHFRNSNGTFVYDYSGNVNHLTVNGATIVHDAKMGAVTNFDGIDDFIRAANNTVYDVTVEDFWMAVMFKRTSDSGGVEVLFAKDSGTVGYSIHIAANDVLQLTVRDGTTAQVTLTTHTIGTNKGYVGAASLDRDDTATLYLYDLTTATLYTQSGSIAGISGSLSNTQTFTVARRSSASSLFFPGYMANLIPPQKGETLTKEQFLYLIHKFMLVKRL